MLPFNLLLIRAWPGLSNPCEKEKDKGMLRSCSPLICAEWYDSGKYADAKNVRLAKKGHNLVGPELRLQEGATLVSHTQTLQATSKEGCDFCTYETSVILSEKAVIGLFVELRHQVAIMCNNNVLYWSPEQVLLLQVNIRCGQCSFFYIVFFLLHNNSRLGPCFLHCSELDL